MNLCIVLGEEQAAARPNWRWDEAKDHDDHPDTPDPLSE
jgi:hypothetical protein